jgi:hypothetical protein
VAVAIPVEQDVEQAPVLGVRLFDALALAAENVRKPTGLEAALPLSAAEGAEDEGREHHQQLTGGRGIEPRSAADLVRDLGLAVAEDVAQDAGALLSQHGTATTTAQEPPEIIEDAAVVVLRQGTQELVGAGRLGGVMGQPSQQGGQGGRHGLPGGIRIDAELLAELRNSVVVELFLDEIDQWDQCTPP